MVWYYDKNLELESLKEDCKERKRCLTKGGAYLLSSFILTTLSAGLLFSDLSLTYRRLGSCALSSLAVFFSIASFRYSSKSDQLTKNIRESINKLENILI